MAAAVEARAELNGQDDIHQLISNSDALSRSTPAPGVLYQEVLSSNPRTDCNTSPLFFSKVIDDNEFFQEGAIDCTSSATQVSYSLTSLDQCTRHHVIWRETCIWHTRAICCNFLGWLRLLVSMRLYRVETFLDDPIYYYFENCRRLDL